MVMRIDGKKLSLVATLVVFALGAGADTFTWSGGAGNVEMEKRFLDR